MHPNTHSQPRLATNTLLWIPPAQGPPPQSAGCQDFPGAGWKNPAEPSRPPKLGLPNSECPASRLAPLGKEAWLLPLSPDPHLPLTHTCKHSPAPLHSPDPQLPNNGPLFLRPTEIGTCTYNPRTGCASSAHEISSVPRQGSATHSSRRPNWLARDLEGAQRKGETW